MINTIEELLDNIFYDWGFCPSPQLKESVNDNFRCFNVNKTDIYHEKNKFYMHYKMDKIELSEEVYNQFCKIADKVKSDPNFEETLTEYHNCWMDNQLEANQGFQNFLKTIKS